VLPPRPVRDNHRGMPRARMPLPYLLYPVIGVVAGWASVAVTEDGAAAPVAPRAGHGGRGDRGADAPWRKEDFLKAAEKRSAGINADDYSVVDELLDGWTLEEIRTALDAAVFNPSLRVNGYDPLAAVLVRGMARRDLDAALAWFREQSEPLRISAMSWYAVDWPMDRAMEGLDFFKEFPEISDLSIAGKSLILSKCLSHAARSGPEALLAMQERLQQEGNAMRFLGQVVYPPGFDYARMMEIADEKVLEVLGSDLIAGWLAEDREAAFRWTLEKRGARELADLLSTGSDAPRDLVKWFLSEVGSLAPQQQEEMLERWAGSFQYRPLPVRFISSAADPDLRGRMAAVVARQVFSSSAGTMLGALECLPDVEERVRALEAAEPAPDQGSRNLGKHDLKQIRAAMVEWQVEPQRVEAVINRLKGDNR